MSEAGILKIICSNGGAIYYESLFGLASALSGINRSDLDSLIENKQLFFLTETSGVKQVLAKTNVKLCKVRDCKTNCKNLHLCKFHLLGECCNRRCDYGHDLNLDHNRRVLAIHQLQKLNRAEIRQLLLQNDIKHSLLPQLCFSYNRGNGEFGQCDDKDNCRRLHICQDHIHGTCDSGHCNRSHDFSKPHTMKTLQGRGVPSEMTGSMFSIYKSILMLKGTSAKGVRPDASVRCGEPDNGDATATANTSVTKDEKSPAQSEMREICLSYIRADCKYRNKCWRVHSKMPYQWQVKIGEKWTDLPNSEDIERDFCNPINATALSGSDSIYFDIMTCGPHEVRRLSTASSVRLPEFILTTEWLWYWEEEYGKWNLYGSTEIHRMSSFSSSDLEKLYQDDSKATVPFTAGEQQYELSFKDMVQKNVKFGTQRLVRRRPKLVSSDDVQIARASKRKGPASQHVRGVPESWNKSAIPEKGYMSVALQSTDQDYLNIQKLFRTTLAGFQIDRIERIQNKKLWEDFQMKRDQMKKANKGKKDHDGERMLFHGTKSEFIHAISNHNFDWRKSGANGADFGRGCYFAQDASYSNFYTSDHGERCMFMCRVLVGSYTQGQSHYHLPPSRDGGNILYDSCVNDIHDPSIFVVFDKQQIYPEYLITYSEDLYLSPPASLAVLPSQEKGLPSASPTTGESVSSSSGKVPVQLSSSATLSPGVGASSSSPVSSSSKPSAGSAQNSHAKPIPRPRTFRSSALQVSPASNPAASATPLKPANLYPPVTTK